MSQQADVVAKLHPVWVQLLSDLNVPENTAVSVWDDLLQRYSENGRFYHNLVHIDHTLQIAQDLQDEAADFRAVQLAIWFHDIVYDAKGQDNEEKSAMMAGRALFQWELDEALIAEVVRLILLTKSHVLLGDDQNGRVMLDADLSILGAPDASYDAYAQAVRQEYGFVADDVYRQGRTLILQQFLSRPTIFTTEPMRLLLEPQARQNIRRELASLAA